MSDSPVATRLCGAVLEIRLCRPAARNSLSAEMRAHIGDAVARAEQDRAVRAVYLTGTGTSFCSGGDLKVIQAEHDPWSVHRRFAALRRWLLPLLYLPKPVVVGINGHAVGGGMGLALGGDVLIAAEDAVLVTGFFRLGALPDLGVMYQLPRLIGMARAKALLFGNGQITAAEALALGIVSRVVPREELDEAGMGEAQRLANGPIDAMGLTKSIMARSFETSMADMFNLEGFGQALAMSSPEFHEGMAAMQERRHPDFPAAAAAAPGHGGESGSPAPTPRE